MYVQICSLKLLSCLFGWLVDLEVRPMIVIFGFCLTTLTKIMSATPDENQKYEIKANICDAVRNPKSRLERYYTVLGSARGTILIEPEITISR